MGARIRQLTGRIKQAAGSLIGNRKLEREGRNERRSGQARHRFDMATDKARHVIDWSADADADADADAAADAMGRGRNGRRPS